MKILITGGAGFIAYHLTRELEKRGNQVVGIDNFNDYYDVKLKEARAERLQNVIMCDLINKAHLDNVIKKEKPDVVIHLAAYAGVRHSLEQPRKYIDVNIVGTQNLIEVCEANDVKKVVYASTSCVMAGNPLPWKEDEPTGHQLNPYGYSKRTNECQFKTSKIQNTVGLRFFTVYGPWGRPDMALFTFTKNILEGKPIVAFNYGNMIRDFTYVDDIVSGICIVTETEIANGEIFNIGRGEQVQLMDFIKHIEKNVGKEAIIDFQPKHPADTHATWSDTTKLQALGYKPTVSIGEGVENFVKWYKEYYNV